MPRNLNVVAPSFEQGMNPEELRDLQRCSGEKTMDSMVKLGETDDGYTVSVAPELMSVLQRYKDRRAMVPVDGRTEIATMQAGETAVANVTPNETMMTAGQTQTQAAEAPKVDAEADRQARIAELERELARLKRPEAIDAEYTEVKEEPAQKMEFVGVKPAHTGEIIDVEYKPVDERQELAAIAMRNREMTPEPVAPAAGQTAPMEQDGTMVASVEAPKDEKLSVNDVPVETLRQEAQQASAERVKEISTDAMQQAAGEGLGDLTIHSMNDIKNLETLNPETEAGARRLVDWTEAKRLTEGVEGHSGLNFDGNVILKSMYLKERQELMGQGMGRMMADYWIMKNRGLSGDLIKQLNDDIEDADDENYYIGRGENILRQSQELMQKSVAEGSLDANMKAEYEAGDEAVKAEKLVKEISDKMNALRAELDGLSDSVEDQVRAEQIRAEIGDLSKKLREAYDVRDAKTFEEVALHEAGYAIGERDAANGVDTLAKAKVPEDVEKKAGALEKLREKLVNVLPGHSGFYGFMRRVKAGAAAMLCSLTLASCSSQDKVPAGVEDNSLEITDAMKGMAEAGAAAVLDGLEVDGEPVHLSDLENMDVTGTPESLPDGMLVTGYNGMQYDLSDYFNPDNEHDGRFTHMGSSIAEAVKADPNIAPEKAIESLSNPGYLAGYAAEFPDVLEKAGLPTDSTPQQILDAIYMRADGKLIQQTLIEAVTKKFNEQLSNVNVRAGQGERVVTSWGETRNYLDPNGNQVKDQYGNPAVRIDYRLDYTDNTRGKDDTIIEFTFTELDKDGTVIGSKVIRERADCRQIDKDLATPKKTTTPETPTATVTPPPVVEIVEEDEPELPSQDIPVVPPVVEEEPGKETPDEEEPGEEGPGEEETVVPPVVPPEEPPVVPPVVPPEEPPVVPPVVPPEEPPVVPPVVPPEEPPVVVEDQKKNPENEIINGSLSGDAGNITQTPNVQEVEDVTTPVINDDGTINKEAVDETQGLAPTPVESTTVADDNRDVVEGGVMADSTLTQEEQQEVANQVADTEQKADEMENREEMTQDELDDYIDSLMDQLGDRDAGY